MKRFLKSAGLPIGVFALAIGSAFATNGMKNSKFFVDETAYQKMDIEGAVCIERSQCNTVDSKICTWTDPVTNLEHPLYGKRLNEDSVTLCSEPLFKD